LSAVLLPAQQYLISEAELQKLESILESWETDKQNLLSQARGLKGTAEKLRTESKTLNEQLQTERTITRSLRQSFETSEAAHISRAVEMEQKIDTLSQEKAETEKNLLEVRNQRNIVIGIAAFGFICVAALIFLKLRGLF
jgi:predicted  nucleic acid-binding Zn-ribbon protein